VYERIGGTVVVEHGVQEGEMGLMEPTSLGRDIKERASAVDGGTFFQEIS